jgi:hypothetical protein
VGDFAAALASYEKEDAIRLGAGAAAIDHQNPASSPATPAPSASSSGR